MEAPEKIYLNKNNKTLLDILSVKDTERIEYICKDTFIEKACLWLSNVSIEDMTYKYGDFDTSENWDKFIGDFRKYMSL